MVFSKSCPGKCCADVSLSDKLSLLFCGKIVCKNCGVVLGTSKTQEIVVGLVFSTSFLFAVSYGFIFMSWFVFFKYLSGGILISLILFILLPLVKIENESDTK